jgi:hypothetical protein
MKYFIGILAFTFILSKANADYIDDLMKYRSDCEHAYAFRLSVAAGVLNTDLKGTKRRLNELLENMVEDEKMDKSQMIERLKFISQLHDADSYFLNKEIAEAKEKKLVCEQASKQ